MNPIAARDLITRYYAAFNAHDMGTFLSLLTGDVVHDRVRSQGQVLNARDWMRQPLALSGLVQAVPL